ncbi:hypothetical protein, partial [Gordonia aichiensis]
MPRSPSATLGEVDFFAEDLERRTGRATAVVAGTERPVPLTFSYVRTPITETLEELVTTAQYRRYIANDLGMLADLPVLAAKDTTIASWV